MKMNNLACCAWLTFAAVIGSSNACIFDSDCQALGDRGAKCINSACQCDKGFIVPDCAPFCTNRTSCANHGNCDSDACVCDPGWSGVRCATASCILDCTHGGTPNTATRNCTHCVGCAFGWGGQNCSAWDPSTNMTDLVAAIHRIGNASAAAQHLLKASLNIIPGTVGAGANIVTGELTGLPIVAFTYKNMSDPARKVWHNFTVMEEAVLTDEPNAQGAVTAEHVWQSLGEYERDRAAMAQAVPPQGRNGLFAAPLVDVFSNQFNHTGSPGVTLVQWTKPIYSLDLPVDPKTKRYDGYKLDAYVRDAINVMPPEYNTSTHPAFEAFVKLFGTSYTQTSTNGGMVEMQHLWTSWLTTQEYLWDKAGGGPSGFTTADLANYAEYDLSTQSGGLPNVRTGTMSTYYQDQLLQKTLTCLGGDPAQCGGGAIAGNWTPTIVEAPDPIQWTFGPIEQLITDAHLAANIGKAIQDYVAAANAAWRATDVCPTCTYGFCDAGSHASTCTCKDHGDPAETYHAMGNGCQECEYGWSPPDHCVKLWCPRCTGRNEDCLCEEPFMCNCYPDCKTKDCPDGSGLYTPFPLPCRHGAGGDSCTCGWRRKVGECPNAAGSVPRVTTTDGGGVTCYPLCVECPAGSTCIPIPNYDINRGCLPGEASYCGYE